MNANWEPAVLDMVAALVAVLDREGRIVGWNSACEKTSGFAFEEVRGKFFWAVAVEPGQGDAFKALFAELRAGSFPDRREGCLETRDGNRRCIAWTSTAALGPDGQVTHVVATGVDISEHKQAQEGLKRSQESMARAQAIARMGNWERDVTTNQVYWSDEMYRLMGVSPHEPLEGYQDFLKLVHPEDRERVKKAAGEAVRDGVPYSADYRMLRSDGTTLPVHAMAEVLRDEHGRPRWLVGTTQDITERKRAEEADHFLSEASKVLASSLDYSVTLAKVAQLAVPRLADWCVVQVKGEDGVLRIVRIAHADPRKADLARDMRRGFVTPPSSVGSRVLGSGQADLESDITDEDLVATAIDAPHLAALRRAGIRSRITVPLVAEGRTLGVLIFASAESGHRYGPKDLSLAEEVGRRAALAIANARLYETAQRAIQAREDLMAVVSHDIRTPLAVINLHASMLQQMLSPSGNEYAAKKVASIRQSANQITLLVGDLLDAATIEAGKLAIERQPHDAGSLIQEAVETARPLADQKSLRIERQVAQGLPAVVCDRRRVLQALANLLTNAIKFTAERGRIRIGVELRGGDVTFFVADTGIGIPEEALHHLCERYWQADQAKRAGAGLGLYIVKGIVEAHGGRVWAESKLGEGSTFFFTLPMNERPARGRTGLATEGRLSAPPPWPDPAPPRPGR